MEKIAIISRLKKAHDEYFKLLLDTYPTKHPITEDSSFGNPRLCELAAEAQACLIALGPGAQNRMIAIGFDFLYPFNNIVDQYTWRSKIIEIDFSFTNFASIAIRLDAEIQIMEKVLEMDGENHYDSFSDEIFIKSKARYLESNPPTPPANDEPYLNSPPQGHTTNNADSEAVDSLIKHERRTNILYNYANVATIVKGIFG